jgi:hypothetical protein
VVGGEHAQQEPGSSGLLIGLEHFQAQAMARLVLAPRHQGLGSRQRFHNVVHFCNRRPSLNK